MNSPEPTPNSTGRHLPARRHRPETIVSTAAEYRRKALLTTLSLLAGFLLLLLGVGAYVGAWF